MSPAADCYLPAAVVCSGLGLVICPVPPSLKGRRGLIFGLISQRKEFWGEIVDIIWDCALREGVGRKKIRCVSVTYSCSTPQGVKISKEYLRFLWQRGG